jgi:iron(III) transport system permease protein
MSYSRVAPWLVAAVVLLPLIGLMPGQDRLTGVVAPEPIAWRTFLASVAVAAAVAACAVALGGLLAAATSLTDLPGRALWATLLVFPFVAPGAAWALGQTYCYGPGGLMERWCGDAWRPWLAALNSGGYAATVLVLAEVLAPLAMLLLGRGMVRLTAGGFDAARLSLAPGRLARWLVGALRPEIGAAFLLCFALALGNFAVPHVLQCRLYTIEIFFRLTNYLDPAGAVVAAWPLLATSLIVAAAIAYGERGADHADARALPEAPPIELGWRVWPVAAALLVYLSLSCLLPVAATVDQCRSWGDFVGALRAAAPETANTLRIASVAATLAAGAGWIVGRRTAHGGWVLRLLALVPLALPSLVLGLAWSRFFNRSWPVNLAVIGNSAALVTLALAARAWPFATRLIASAEARQAPEWREAAQLAGWGPLVRWRRLVAPLLAADAAAALVVGFVLSVGDVELGQLLCAPGSGTLVSRLFTFLHFGPAHVAASLALCELALASVPILVYYLLADRRLAVV